MKNASLSSSRSPKGQRLLKKAGLLPSTAPTARKTNTDAQRSSLISESSMVRCLDRLRLRSTAQAVSHVGFELVQYLLFRCVDGLGTDIQPSKRSCTPSLQWYQSQNTCMMQDAQSKHQSISILYEYMPVGGAPLAHLKCRYTACCRAARRLHDWRKRQLFCCLRLKGLFKLASTGSRTQPL